MDVDEGAAGVFEMQNGNSNGVAIPGSGGSGSNDFGLSQSAPGVDGLGGNRNSRCAPRLQSCDRRRRQHLARALH